MPQTTSSLKGSSLRQGQSRLPCKVALRFIFRNITLVGVWGIFLCNDRDHFIFKIPKNINHYGSSGASQQKREKLDKKGECRDMAPVVLGQNGGASARLSGVRSK